MKIELTNNGKIFLEGHETNFYAQEFLPPEVYNHPSRNPLWYLDPLTVFMVQFCRDWFATPVYLNNWHKGGDRDLAGYRTPETGIEDYLLEHGFEGENLATAKRLLLSSSDNTAEELRIGSWWSQHKFMRAADPVFKNLTADKVRKEIIDNQEEFIAAGITTLESGQYAPTWVHMDRRPTGMQEILIVGI